MNLGVVVSCYRQEAYLPVTLRAIESALAGEPWQGVLVLSAAGPTPATAGAGWNVIAPSASWPLTPGASRMLGFAACGGTHVLFVDADVEVDAAWIRAALARARGESSVAGVWGRLEEWFIDGQRERQGSDDLLRVGRTEREVDYMTALSLYRRDALLAAGGYDARLRSEEDFELGLRLRESGARLVLLGMRAGRHWSAPRPNLAELVRRWRTGLCFGQGQVLRLYLGRPGFFTLLKRQGLYIATLAGWCAGALALTFAAFGHGAGAFWTWAVLAIFGFVVLGIRKRSARLALLAILTWTLNGLGMVFGIVRGLDRDVAAGAGRPA